MPKGDKHGGYKHGGYGTPEYRIWRGLRERCLNSRSKHFARYGGRGIRVCDRWNDFAAFLADMGKKPSPTHSIDREDVNGHYEPGNCRWATPTQQANNRRNTVHVEANGETRPAAEAARAYGLNFATLKARLRRGMSPVDALALDPRAVSRGERNPRARITDAQRAEIQAVPFYYGVNKDLGQKYGLTPEYVSFLRRGRRA